MFRHFPWWQYAASIGGAIGFGLFVAFLLAAGWHGSLSFLRPAPAHEFSPLPPTESSITTTTPASLFAKLSLGSVNYLPADFPRTGKALVADLINLELTVYEDGSARKSYPILAKGRPGSAWETPAGQYQVLTKETKHFSSIGHVWMPYSLEFFGNFFIHGWPYYPNGVKVARGYSGGCIRLSTADAKAVFDFAELGTQIFVVGSEAYPPVTASRYYARTAAARPMLTANGYLVADVETGDVILARKKDNLAPIASVTKLMTALIALETLDQSKIVKLTPSMVVTEGDTGSLQPGERLSVNDLLYPLLLESSNDAAEALAQAAGRKQFLANMNERVRSIGLTKTRFDDPSGLSIGNVSTPEELFKLAQYLHKNKKYVFDLTRRETMTVGRQTWVNHNPFVAESIFVGGKNGLTAAAGQTTITLFSLPLAEFQERVMAIVLLGSTDREGDSRAILNYLTNHVYYGERPPALAQPRRVAGALAAVSPPVRLLFVGDLMLDRGVKQSVVDRGAGDYRWLFKQADFLKNADLTFGNLEGPISLRGAPVGSEYSFRLPPIVAPVLAGAGFDVLSVANNHAGDWGREALADTLDRLRAAKIEPVGGGADRGQAIEPAVFEIKGQKIGWLAFSDVGPAWLAAGTKPGILLADDPALTRLINDAASRTDVLIVAYHFGNEYQKEPSERQKELAHLAIDQGAKIVIGHHPHVIGPVERYRDGVIAYSLGNFIFDQAFSVDTMKGLVLTVEVADGKLTNLQEQVSVLNQFFQPGLVTIN